MLCNWQLRRKWAPPSRDPMESVCAVQWSNRVSWRLCFSFASLIMMIIIIIIKTSTSSSAAVCCPDVEKQLRILSLRRARPSSDAKLSAFRWVAPCDARIDFACFFCSTAGSSSPPCPVTVCRIIYFLALQLATKADEGLPGESILTHLPSFPFIIGVVSCKPRINVIN